MTEFNINWLYILCASVGITGLIQWAKGIAKDPKNIWSYFSPFLSIGGAILLSNFDIVHWKNIVMNSLLVLATSQISYDLLMKPVKKFLGIPESKNEVVNEIVTTKSFNAIGDVPPDLKTKSNDLVG